jgi:GntR family transcriptional regulator
MEGSAPDFKPLYQQVRDLLVQRIVAGIWGPGAALPSEFQLAAEFRVSQGTVRKALDEMAARHLLVRQQGKGTFVATHTPQRALFHFFHLVADNGARALPEHKLMSARAGKATKVEATRLDLRANASVIRIRRLRLLAERTAIVENIVLPAALFPGIERDTLPNELYRYYEQRHGVAVARAVEQLRAVAARPDEAKFLGLKPGAPLLEIDRLAHALDGRPVEWRISRCDTRDHHYVSELT